MNASEPQSPLGAVIHLMKAREGITSRLDPRLWHGDDYYGLPERRDGIYGGELPRFGDLPEFKVVADDPWQLGSVPQGAIVLTESGGSSLGPGARSYVPWSVTRLDILCFHEHRDRASALQRQVQLFLKNLTTQWVDDILVRSCLLSGGPFDAIDPDTHWPYTQGVYDLNTSP